MRAAFDRELTQLQAQLVELGGVFAAGDVTPAGNSSRSPPAAAPSPASAAPSLWKTIR